MKVAIARLDSSAARAAIVDSDPLAGWWVKFDDRLLLVGEQVGVAGAVEREAVIEDRTQENLFLVVQEGRAFQQEYPEIVPLLDKGRFLAVALSETQRDALGSGHAPSFTLQPLQPNSTIFATEPRRDLRDQAQPWLQTLVDRVQRARYEATLAHLVSFRTRHSFTTFFADAADWCQSELDGLGYRTSRQSVAVGNRITANIIADKLGQGSGERKLLMAVAHLDTINQLSGINGAAPGADDNGSGSAGILEIAHVLSDFVPEHDLRLLLVGGEEQGLFGSRHFVTNLSAADRSRLLGVINMDMIGSLNTPEPSVLLESKPLAQQMVDELAQMAATYTTLAVQIHLDAHDSDHVSFLDAGLPSVLTIEGADGANDRVHTANDLLSQINYELALAILKMNVAYLAGKLAG